MESCFCRFSNQSKWEILRYEIRKLSIVFSKALAKRSKKKEPAVLLSKIKKLEQDIASEGKLIGYHLVRTSLGDYPILIPYSCTDISIFSKGKDFLFWSS